MADTPSLGMKPILVLDGAYTQRIAYDGSDREEYIGIAKPGSAAGSAAWQIRRITYTGDKPTVIEWADGNDRFDNVWDNRAGLSYS